MTEMSYQGQICTTVLGETETIFILSCRTCSIANHKEYTYIADNYCLTFVGSYHIMPIATTI